MRPIDADALVNNINERIWALIFDEINEAPTIEPRNIIACEEVDELDMLERMYAEPSGDLISREDAIEVVCRTRCGDKAKGCPAHSCPVIEEFDALTSAETHEIRTETHGVCSDLISREDSIKAVEQEYKIDRGYMADDYTYGFNQAIQYVSDIILHDLPSADRHTDESCRDCPLYDTDNHNCPRFNKVIPQTRAEMNRPQVNSAEWVAEKEKEFEELHRPKGEWIRVTNGRGGHECSNCHAYAPSYMSGDEYLSDFCPNCGARMKGGAE